MPKKPAKPPASPAHADLDVLRELVALLDSSSAGSIKLSRGDVLYEVSRGGVPFVPAPPAMHHAPPVAPPSVTSVTSVTSAPPVSTLIEIKSPMVGTFYRAPEPGADPYVKPASRVAPGQTLCIIEAMKIMNEIESEVSGVIREVVAEDASPVEFGQVLFRVEPNV